MTSVARQMGPRPFVIWTLQRTGGTNLTQRLVEKSGLPGTEHEPFNVGRIYGGVTAAWRESRDRIALARSVTDIAHKGQIIKHCVETVPWDVTHAFADATVQAGYRHLFLYREAPRDRLLSLHFARQTGVWGPGRDGNSQAAGRLLAEPIPVAQLLNHERKCTNRLVATWAYLTRAGGRPRALSYEQVYRSSREQASTALLPILDDLGLAGSVEAAATFVNEVLCGGDQGTRDQYAAIPGVGDLTRGLADMECFDPRADIPGLRLDRDTLPDWVAHAHLDIYPATLQAGRMSHIGGVLVLEATAPLGLTLHLRYADGECPVDWNIASNKMALQYPSAANGRQARFRSPPVDFRVGVQYAMVARVDAREIPLFGFSFRA